MSSNCVFQFHDLSPEEKVLVDKTYKQTNYVRVGDKWFVPSSLKTYGHLLRNFEAREEDVWLLGFTRSGTTVSQEMIWLILNNLDFDAVKGASLRSRFPTFEHILFFNAESNPDNPIQNKLIRESFDKLKDNSGERRLIKSHMSFEFLPENLETSKAKMIYLIRDPKEVLVSNYKVYKEYSVDSEKFVDFETFWKAVKSNLILWAPYFDHLKESWAKRHDENFLVLFYYDLVHNKKEVIKDTAHFLGKTLTEDEVDGLEEYLSNTTFLSKKKTLAKEANNEEAQTTGKSKYVNEVDEWKNYFKNEMADDVEDWIKENLEGSDLKFNSD